MEGATLALWLATDDDEDRIAHGIVRRARDGFILSRPDGKPIPLLPDWAARTHSIVEAAGYDSNVHRVLGEVDYFLLLSVGYFEDVEEAEGLPTDLNWYTDFKKVPLDSTDAESPSDTDHPLP